VFLTLQILQVALFTLPILTLLIYGLIVLIRPVSVIDRRWMLMVFLPLLLANLLAIWENDSVNAVTALTDWRLWLILLTDVALSVGLTLGLRGVLIYGLTAADAAYLTMAALRKEGFEVESNSGEKRSVWAMPQKAEILSFQTEGETEEIWFTSRAGEVLARMDSRRGMAALRKSLPAIRNVQTEYLFSAHAMGVLYLVLGVVLAVLGWIFFFEPRIVLID
jgi:hypothetical protein